MPRPQSHEVLGSIPQWTKIRDHDIQIDAHKPLTSNPLEVLHLRLGKLAFRHDYRRPVDHVECDCALRAALLVLEITRRDHLPSRCACAFARASSISLAYPIGLPLCRITQCWPRYEYSV